MDNIFSPMFPYLEKKHLSSKYKIFCFSHAGGSASRFLPWMKQMKNITVIPIELPGKNTRMKVELPTDLWEVVDDVARNIVDLVDYQDKIFIYGHSFGALLAFYVTYQLENEYGIEIAKLIVAARQSVNVDKKESYNTTMGDEELIKELEEYGGTPELFWQSRELQKIYLPIIKSDYKLNEQHVYHDEHINASILAHIGNQDRDITIADIKCWNDVTKGNFEYEVFEGNHFFPFKTSSSYYLSLETKLYSAEGGTKGEH